jgi:hypothetical protein
MQEQPALARVSNDPDLVALICKQSELLENDRFNKLSGTLPEEIEHHYRVIAIHESWAINTHAIDKTGKHRPLAVSQEAIKFHKDMLGELHELYRGWVSRILVGSHYDDPTLGVWQVVLAE